MNARTSKLFAEQRAVIAATYPPHKQALVDQAVASLRFHLEARGVPVTPDTAAAALAGVECLINEIEATSDSRAWEASRAIFVAAAQLAVTPFSWLPPSEGEVSR